jgi:oligopeptidase B
MRTIFFSLLFILLNSCAQIVHAPPATKSNYELKNSRETRVDPYYWMRDLNWTNDRSGVKEFKGMKKEIQEHLLAENAYSSAYLKKVKKPSETIFEEIKKLIPSNDQDVPYFSNGYFYYHRLEENLEYPIYCRKLGSLDAKEEIFLDVNHVAGDSKVLQMNAWSISPDNNILAYAVDANGSRVHTIYFKDLEKNELLPFKLENVTESFVWAGDSKHLFLSIMDPKSMRNAKIARYSLETKTLSDIFVEKNVEFDVYPTVSFSKKYIFLQSSASESTEVWVINRNQPLSKPKLFKRRVAGQQYFIDHVNDHFYVRTNSKNVNYDLFEVKENSNWRSWIKFINLDPSIFIEDFVPFQKKMVILKREKGTRNLLVVNYQNKKSFEPKHSASGYIIELNGNKDASLSTIRFSYQTPTQPEQVFDLDIESGEKVLKKEIIFPSYKPELYVSERRYVKARDDKMIPVTLVYRKDLKISIETPVLMHGYGSYGMNREPYFRNYVISLIDRDFIYVIPHIRGSSFLGRQWYLDGKFLKKKNTFNDFVDVSKYLIQEKMTNPKKLFAMGGSAGGLLMGAVANDAPELFAGMIAQVPFVDVLTTMLDSDLPLTTGEYQEWGNPNLKQYYDYMKSYSPFDNVSAKNYPKMFITGGIHDTQVGYWEPTKWAAKLRDHQLSKENPILLKIELDSGHSGESGRYGAFKDLAEQIALLDFWAKSNK